MDLSNPSKQEPLPRLRELCMIVICDKYSQEEINKLHLPTEVKEVLFQKKSLDITFNKLSGANGRGLHTAMFVFASRGKEILPYLNEKLLSAKSWRERLLVKAIKAMIFNADLLYHHNDERREFYAMIMPKSGQVISSYDESGSGLVCDYVLARVLCMMPIDSSTFRALDSNELTPQEVYSHVLDAILRHYNHPEVIPMLIWTLVHSDLAMNSYESLFQILSAPQRNYLVQIIQSNLLKMTVEQLTRVMRVVAAVNERDEIANITYAETLHSFMENNIAYLLSSEHLLVESIFNGFGTLQYMPGLENIFKILLIAVEHYRSSAVFSAKLLSPGIIRGAIIKYGDKAVPFLQEVVNNAENLMAQVVGNGVLFEIECPAAAHDFYQTVTEYLDEHRMNVNGTGYVAFHQATHRYQIEFVIPTALKVPFYLHCEAFLTHRKINPANAPCFVVNEFGRRVLAKRFTIESSPVQIKTLDSLIGHTEHLGELFMSLVTSGKLDLRVLLKLIEVSILSTIRNETLFSLLTERLNQLAASSDAQKVLYGHDLLNHLAPIVMSLDSDAHVIPADTISQLLSAHSDYEGEHSLHYFCAHYLVQFHNNFSHLDVILKAICVSTTGREMARELYNVAKGPLFAEALEQELNALKKQLTQNQSKSILKKTDEFNMDDVKCRVLCEYLLVKIRNNELFNNFRAGMEKPRQSFSQRGGPQLADFERAARFFVEYLEDVPLLEYEVMFPDSKAVYHPSLAALALALLRNKTSLPVLVNFLYSTHYDIKVPYRALELYGEEAVPAITSIVDKTSDRSMANSLRKVLQQISHKQMSLDNVLETIQKYNAETVPKSDLLSCLEAVKNYTDNLLVKATLFKWIPLQTDMEIKSRAIEVFWSWKASIDVADFCAEHLQYYDKESNVNLSEPAFKVFSAHTGVESGVRFLIDKLSSQEHASGCLLGVGKIFENAYICHERDFGPFAELRYSNELKELVLNSILDTLKNSTQKSKQTNDIIQSAVRALRAVVQVYQTRPYPEDDVFDLTPVMTSLQMTSKRLALHWPLQQLLISTVVKMCFSENLTGPGQITDRSGIEVILSCIDDQLNTLQRKEDINWLARTVQDFLAASKEHRAVAVLSKVYELTEYQNTRLAELLCSFEDQRVVSVVHQGLVKLLGKLSVTYQELASYLRGLLQLQPTGQKALLDLVAAEQFGLKERCQTVLALAQHSAITVDQVKQMYWDVIDMGLFHPALPYDGRKHAYQTCLEYLSQSLVLLDATCANQSLKQALMIYSGDEDICAVLESSLNQVAPHSNEGTGNLALDNKYLPNAVLEWAKKNKPSNVDDSYYNFINTLKETLRTTDKNQIRVNKKILSQDLTRTVQLFIDMFHYCNVRLGYEQLKSTILRLNNNEHEAVVELCFSCYSQFTVHQLLTELDLQLTAQTKYHLLMIVVARETSPWWLIDRVKVASLTKVLFTHLTSEQVIAVMSEENQLRILGIKVHPEDFLWATRLKEVLTLLK